MVRQLGGAHSQPDHGAAAETLAARCRRLVPALFPLSSRALGEVHQDLRHELAGVQLVGGLAAESVNVEPVGELGRVAGSTKGKPPVETMTRHSPPAASQPRYHFSATSALHSCGRSRLLTPAQERAGMRAEVTLPRLACQPATSTSVPAHRSARGSGN